MIIWLKVGVSVDITLKLTQEEFKKTKMYQA
jgi:hypothetical protein